MASRLRGLYSCLGLEKGIYFSLGQEGHIKWSLNGARAPAFCIIAARVSYIRIRLNGCTVLSEFVRGFRFYVRRFAAQKTLIQAPKEGPISYVSYFSWACIIDASAP